MTADIHQVLAKFLPLLSPEEIESICRQLEYSEIGKGDRLYSSGDKADCLYFVVEGMLAVHEGVQLSDRTQVVALLGAGTIIGEAALVGGKLRGATVLAVEDSKVALLSSRALANLEENTPKLFVALLKKILSITSLRLRKSSERLALVL